MTEPQRARVPDYEARRTEAMRILPALMRNPLSAAGVACSVCAAPIDPHEKLCWRCLGQRQQWGDQLADIIVPLTYAGARNRQAMQDLWQYKNSDVPQVRQLALYRLSHLSWWAVVHHAQCLDRLAGPVTALTTVPSGHAGARVDGHPIERLAIHPRPLVRVHLVRTRDAAARDIDPDSLQLTGRVRGQHVLLVDDTWTTGASTQGAAIALRRAGAARVSVLVLGRWLNDGWPPTQRFQQSRPDGELWDPSVCPVTRDSCP